MSASVGKTLDLMEVIQGHDEKVRGLGLFDLLYLVDLQFSQRTIPDPMQHVCCAIQEKVPDPLSRCVTLRFTDTEDRYAEDRQIDFTLTVYAEGEIILQVDRGVGRID